MLVCTVVVIILIVRWRISARKQVDTAHEHVEMNTNDAYTMNSVEVANVAYTTAEVTTTGNVAYMTAENGITATQNVAYGQVPPGTDDYDYL